jgi:hypothetical protein
MEAGMSEEKLKEKDAAEGVWAAPVDRLQVASTPEGVTALNIQGRHAVGALQGFGQLWKKTY